MRLVVNLDIMMAKRKLTLTEVSEKTGVSMAALSMLKNNNVRGIRIGTLEKILTAYDCELTDIFELVTDEKYRQLFVKEKKTK